MFDFQMLAGDTAHLLEDPYSALLTRKTAIKYFGDWRSALGKTFKHENRDVYRITGILKDVPANTDFPLDVIVPFAALKHTPQERSLKDWVSTEADAYTFFTLKNGPQLLQLERKLPAFNTKHKPAEFASDRYFVQPLAEMHFDSRFGNFNYRTFSHNLVGALMVVGLFLIVVACVNFINLATAQSLNRAKEVGVRKTLGSSRGQLTLQFLTETTLVVCCSLLLAILWAYIALPHLNRLLEISMSPGLLASPTVITGMITGLLGIIALSGLYPAMIQSGYKPVTALKQKNQSRTGKGITVRRSLVVFQFTIAQVLIMGMLIVVSQMHLFRSASMGFNRSAIVTVQLPGDSASEAKFDYLRDELVSNREIESVSFSFASPSSEWNWDTQFRYDHSTKSTHFEANLKWADPAYFSLYGLQFIAGHVYSPSDTVREFVVNETLLKKLGVRQPSEAIGKQINFWNGRTTGEIVGVIRDFNARSLHRPIEPVVMSTWKSKYQVVNVRIRAGSESRVLPFIEKIWNSVYPDHVYNCKFLDDTINGYYLYEDQLAQLYKIFAGIAIFISCMGLYGLVSFMALQRTKELGIRKVLGASSKQIILLLSREFMLLIVIAFLVSVPVAYYLMSNWLQNFAYRITPGIGVFMAALIATVAVAWISVGYRAIRASLVNPVKSLRTE
jgi:ABC-type antimicrobial peptide transport system permease subunit